MSRFDYFILLAEMRTGSNLLEANINMLDGVTCHGEAFNPSFVGYPKTDALLGIDRDAREKDPFALLGKIRESERLAGFRFFHDHDPRILNTCIADPCCAKIILTRNPLDSFVSWKIAQATGQWKLTNATHSKSTSITFDPAAFEAHLEAIQAFQVRVQRALQTSGQTAFYINYDDLRDLDVLNGLAQFLEVETRLPNVNKKLKKQNPAPLEERVSNYDEMTSALARLDRFDLGRTPHFEPNRGPAIPSYVAAPQSGVLYMPLRSGPDRAVRQWLADLDDAQPEALIRKFTQKSLRTWQEAHNTHRSFAVLRHPLARAHAAFCDRILLDGPQNLPEIRANLIRVHKLALPQVVPDLADTGSYSDADHRRAFSGFLDFLKTNLAGQTSIRVDPSWASQLTLLQGMAQFGLPDHILREETLAEDLGFVARQVGLAHSPTLADTAHRWQGRLAAIYDPTLEAAARDAYARDYAAFGFENWR
ncbi:nodulation protein NodH [Loktanella sp. 5RATIMAR09]|uniref:sulfotransferase family 2 domain-containing protein n=1 Tax=Loktanella sp. 5RATIMAR09 TaxID=1225655 RepID=UPI0006EBD7F2|nr:sulfotransferase family 2 domain-containing protein [Loktanella sp. 5RATIMAR09]KQI73633.1 nodulation protein NodH [Loktanella sp. 5RATIMAR09]